MVDIFGQKINVILEKFYIFIYLNKHMLLCPFQFLLGKRYGRLSRSVDGKIRVSKVLRNSFGCPTTREAEKENKRRRNKEDLFLLLDQSAFFMCMRGVDSHILTGLSLLDDTSCLSFQDLSRRHSPSRTSF